MKKLALAITTVALSSITFTAPTTVNASNVTVNDILTGVCYSAPGVHAGQCSTSNTPFHGMNGVCIITPTGISEAYSNGDLTEEEYAISGAFLYNAEFCNLIQ